MNLKYYILVLIFLIFNLNSIYCQKIEECDYENDENDYEDGDDADMQKSYLEVFTKKACPSFGLLSENEDETFTEVKPDMFFFDSSPYYREAAMKFKQMLMEKETLKEVFSTAVDYREEINLNLWLNGFVGTMLSRGNGLSPFLPLVELLPDLMLPSSAIERAINETLNPRKKRSLDTCVTVDKNAGTANGIENELWYFREDLMVNSHHWYWHLEYPVGVTVRLDRSGELFYYMHHSMLARYHAERLSNNLSPVIPLVISKNRLVRDPYYTFLKDINSGRNWSSRYPNTRISDVNRTEFGFDLDIRVSDHTRTGKTLRTAARNGVLRTPKGLPNINLKNVAGVDFLGNTLEALDNFSANMEIYGNWHNFGHFILSFIQDPIGVLNVPPGVMGSTATAMRDVIFYQWHTTTDQVFLLHKDTLPPYSPTEGELQLLWPGISIDDFEVRTVGRASPPPANTLYTFWKERRFNISKGLDLLRNTSVDGVGSVDVCVDHLDHDEFEYNITVERSPRLSSNTNATVRIFMAPRFNEIGNRYTMEEQRQLFFVLDTFTVTLSSEVNVITQSSRLSSLTLEYTKSLDQLQTDALDDKPRCGCGWPHHLLIPKGKPLQGMTFDLFAMVTNGENDRVVQESTVNNRRTCSQGYLYCGLMNQKYPDSKPMGYPFDRKVYNVADFDGPRAVGSLEEYVHNIPNMKAIQVTIIHEPDRRERAASTPFMNI